MPGLLSWSDEEFNKLMSETDCASGADLDITYVLDEPIYADPKSTLAIHGDSILLHFNDEKPNRWRRFWCWALLGWRWSDYEE